MNDINDDELSVDEYLGWAEFCCWSALVMAPFIYWIQGPSVSNDQFVVRTALVIITVLGAIGLRGRAIVSRRRGLPKSADIPTAIPLENHHGTVLQAPDEKSM